MDDLNGLSWSNSNAPAKPPPMSSSTLFPNVQSSGNSGRSTPLSATSMRSISPAKPAAPVADSFANLVSFNSSASNKNLSLIEQQKKLQEEKAKKDAADQKRLDAQFGAQNSQFWDNLEAGRTPSPAVGSSIQPTDDDDLLAAFSASAPVDASTNFPIPTSTSSPRPHTNISMLNSGGGMAMHDNSGGLDSFEDDDPFGLNQLRSKQAPAPAATQDDDDDFLGLLGKPVSEIPPQRRTPEPRTTSRGLEERDPSPLPSSDADRAIAELVDMGFPADRSREALKNTSSGTDVQAAVSWLLTQAHAESHKKVQGRSTANGRSGNQEGRSQNRSRHGPSWLEDQTPRVREDSRSPAPGEKDAAQIASQFGNNLLKTANSWWKTGSKKVQQAVNEFNTEHDPSQPKWMRDASESREESLPPRQPPRRAEGTGQPQEQKASDFTDEAILLEAGNPRPRKPLRPFKPSPDGNDLRHQPSPVSQQQQQQQQPNFLQHPSRQPVSEPRSRASRFAAEEQPAQAYQKPTWIFSILLRLHQTARTLHLLLNPHGPNLALPLSLSDPKHRPALSHPYLRKLCNLTHRHREKAAEAYKRGDYAAAHQSFSTALSMLPEKHPITVMIRSNRAMTGLRIGEPKAAIEDADTILDVIGPSRGEGEMIDLGNGESAKPMKDFFGKALMRKAEALEQLERWADAAQVWKSAVEAGHGGSTSIQGRNRCEKAAGISKPPSKPVVPVKKAAPAPKKASALSDLSGSGSGQDFEAVNRLREANKAAERADEEKFALSESVDARIEAWKGGKQDNLRALLGSLDTVLWPEAGWKKISLAELVLPNKVKIQYMKGIAKVHPDKIPTNATTEQRMISSAVFGTLNEAWDKFRVENNL
ncbi:hypothetical protein N7468_003581 [Penicillium chermesinum]|uniref:UBA domain-containing protein n=1 Tax=Penicillium chermesinum TaxID=63820 RepID=A0A9W9P9I9_9EURO|nr:uncharacterized protein N7468_003581 [Penicillium chermesinum]KAJ5238962.1 hypothetical protein N7468_003581 [Penicillium chermesinum]